MLYIVNFHGSVEKVQNALHVSYVYNFLRDQKDYLMVAVRIECQLDTFKYRR